MANRQVRCNLKDKRGNCWEAPNGQIQCNDDALTGDDGSSTHGGSTSQDNSTDSPTAVDTDSNTSSTSTYSTDEDTMTDVGTSATADTCVRTADGRLECGNAMSKREHHDSLEQGSPKYPYYASCPSGPDGTLHCTQPSLTTPGDGGRSLYKRAAVAGKFIVPSSSTSLGNRPAALKCKRVIFSQCVLRTVAV